MDDFNVMTVVVLSAAAVGLLVNTLAVLGIAWRGGRVLGKMETSLESIATEVKLARQMRERMTEIITRAVAQLDDLERRVERLENSR